MKLGISAFAWTGEVNETHLDIFSQVRGLGYETIELPMFEPAALPVVALRRACEVNALDCINPISDDAGVRARSLSHLVRCVETAAELGASLIGGPIVAPIGYQPGHRPSLTEWAHATDALHALTPELDRYGIDLSMEPVNRSETFFIRTASNALRLCEAVEHPLVGVTIDTFHANIEERSISTAIKSLGKHLKHVHLSENDRGPLGSGHIDLHAVLRTLKQLDYTGHLVVEGFGYSAGETTSPGYLWADQSVSPHVLAFSGFEFLKQQENG
jgi:D-psicose/D-tagatose/L-ribulose 3-epimerase